MPDRVSSTEVPALKAAVIGVGYLGRFHAQKYARIKGVELVAVADLLPERARRVGQELGVQAVANFVELLDQVDLVSVVTPTPTHYSVAKACLLAGVHLLLEKPMTVSLAEADELIELAKDRQRILQVGHIKRFHPVVTALDQSGMLSRSCFIESHRFAPFKNRALDVDVVLDLMIHDVDLILHFVDSEVVDVEAVGAKVLTGHVDVANARIKFKNGCIATISSSRVARDVTRRMRIFQSNAMFELDFVQQTLRMSRRGEGERELDGVIVPAIEETLLPVVPCDALDAEIKSFCESVRTRNSPVVSGREGRQALEVVLAIRRGIAEFAQEVGS